MEIQTLKIFQKHIIRSVIHDVNNTLISNDALKNVFALRVTSDKSLLLLSNTNAIASD